MDGDRLSRVAPTTVALLAPVVGVVALDWRLASLLGLYWIESGLVTVRTTVEATFADGPPPDEGVVTPPFAALAEKRGCLRLPGLPPVYLRRVPAALDDGLVSALLWVATGGALLGLETGVAAFPTLIDLALAVSAVAAGQFVVFVQTARRGRGGEPPTSGARRRRVVGQVALLVVVCVALAGRDGSLAAAQGAVFAAVVVGRVGAGLAERTTLGRDLASPSWLPVVDTDGQSASGAESADRVADEPTHDSDGVPRETVRPNRSSLLVATLLATPARLLGSRPGILAVAACATGGWVVAETTGVVVATTALSAAAAVVFVVETDLRHGHLEYRLYDDCVVAYDRLLDATQWRVERAAIRETGTATGLLARLTPLALGSVWVETTATRHRLVGLGAPVAVREAVDGASSERSLSGDS